VTAVSALDIAPSGEEGYWAEVAHRLLHDWSMVMAMAIAVALVLVAGLASLLAPHDPTKLFRDGLTANGRPRGPSAMFWLGTDPLGRDEFSRLLYGARVSLFVGIGGNVIAGVFSVVIGGFAGMARRRIQTALMRGVDVILSFPVLLLAVVLLKVTTPSATTILLIIGVTFGAYISRLVFAQVVSLREREFVLAAQMSGVRVWRILLRHILPHILPTVLVAMALGVASAIQFEATLSYVGIGIQPPQASWGNMISDGQTYISTAPWLVFGPGSAIILATLAFSVLGDGLRDALDPTLDRRIQFAGVGGAR
jgi:peptide/nickel transport system permease protein